MGFFDFLRSLWGRGADAPPPPVRQRDDLAGRTAPDSPLAPADEPTPTPSRPASPAASVAGSFADDLVSDLDEAIGAAFDGNAVFGDGGGELQDTGGSADDAARDLFASIAANYSRPIKNFIFELKRGTATKDWIEICQPVINSIIDGAESMDLTDDARPMTDFSEALALATATDGREFDDDSRELILSCYDELIETLPGAFELGEEDQRRESIIIHSLLRQIPEVGHVTLEKLYGAGVTSLDALFLANVEDLTSATGVSEWLCERICDKVQQHRERLESGAADEAQFDHRGRLVELVKDLTRRHEAFETIAEEESAALAAEKRECRRGRQACALQVNVVLAEMGELDLVEEIKRLAFEKRIERLEQYLAETTGAAATMPSADAATTVQQDAR